MSKFKPLLVSKKTFQDLVPKTEAERKAYADLKADERFLNALTSREQIGVACEYLRQINCMVSYQKIGAMFFVNKSIVKDQETKYKFGVLPDGRPPSFTNDEVQELFQYIDSHIDNEALTYEDISEYVYLKFHKDVCKETLRHFITRRFCNDFKSVIGIPMDSKRLDVDENDIDQYFADLEQAIQEVHPYFVYNLDEVGVQDFQDAPQEYVLVRKNYDKQARYYPVNRSGKRITALSCICTNADWIPPMIIVNRSTIDSEIHSIVPADKYFIVRQSKGFLTTSNLKQWFDKIFIPELQLKRLKYNYNGTCLLLMDNFISHLQIMDIIDFDQYNIKVLFIVPHASDQLQPLDLNVFGNQKRQNSAIKNEKFLTSQTNRISRLIDSLWKASSPKNVASAFRSSGLLVTCRSVDGIATIYVGVRRGAARAVRHYNDSLIERNIQQNIPLSASQTMAKNKLTMEEIHKNSFRIKI